MQQWRTRSRRTVLDLSPWVSVETHVVELPDGQVIEDWPWLESRDHVNVVALTKDEARGVCPRRGLTPVTVAGLESVAGDRHLRCQSPFC
jgi:hypothetical protein